MAKLRADEIEKYRADGFVIPRFRLPAARTAAMLERNLRPADGKTDVAVDLANCPLWLVKGLDRSGRNDLAVGHRR